MACLYNIHIVAKLIIRYVTCVLIRVRAIARVHVIILNYIGLWPSVIVVYIMCHCKASLICSFGSPEDLHRARKHLHAVRLPGAWVSGRRVWELSDLGFEVWGRFGASGVLSIPNQLWICIARAKRTPSSSEHAHAKTSSERKHAQLKLSTNFKAVVTISPSDLSQVFENTLTLMTSCIHICHDKCNKVCMTTRI